MMSEPQGPIYLCYDAALQEAPLTEEVRLPNPASAKTPGKLAPDMKALADIADRLIAADWPVLLPQYAGRRPGGLADMVALAEATGAAVSDVQSRLNFPTNPSARLPHEQGCVPARRSHSVARLPRLGNARRMRMTASTAPLKPLYPAHCQWADIGFADIEISKWAMGYQKFPTARRVFSPITELAIPQLTELCTQRVVKDAKAAKRIAERKTAIAAMHNARRAKWREEAKEGWDSSPISLPRLASEVWEQIRNEDWVLTTQAFEDWALKLWDFDRAYRWPGKALGTGTQIGMAIGVALAHRGKGRLGGRLSDRRRI